MRNLSTSQCLSLLLLALLLWPRFASAQTPQPNPLNCGTVELTQKQKLDLDAAAKFALQVKKANSPQAFTGITYVPIRPHIFRSGAGAGGYTTASLNAVIARTNYYFLLNGSGIQFYLAGTTPDYIDNDAYYPSFPAYNETIADQRDVSNALNMYFVNYFNQGGLGGYAYYPGNYSYTTRSFIAAGTGYNDNDVGNRLIPHELGHNFNLIHTFNGSTDNNYAELVTRGSGANCTTAGDLVCDTPADPYGRTGASTNYVNNCQAYNGTATDPTGAVYSPSITNIMSYYFPCVHDFSPGQYDRIQAGLALRQSHTAYTLNYPPPAVAAPSNFSVVLTSGGNVQLSWKDNANNEMGYFIERANSPTDGFGSIGGVDANVTSFTDNTINSNSTYYYRIRPSNTTTGSLSPVRSLTTPTVPCKPTYTTGCQYGAGIAGFRLNGVDLSQYSGCSDGGYSEFTQPKISLFANQVYPLLATKISSNINMSIAVWLDSNRNGVYETNEQVYYRDPADGATIPGNLTIPASVTAGLLTMRVTSLAYASPIGACDTYGQGETEDYTINVITTCPAATNLTTTATSTAGAQLAWDNAGDGLTYDLQWRQQGTANWTTVSSLSVNGYALTGLQPGTRYEFQVKTNCLPVSSAGYSASVLFKTSSVCTPPTNLTAQYMYYYSTFVFYTPAGPGITSDLRYRPQGSNAWTLVENFTNNYNGAGYLNINLPNNAQVTTIFNWQMRTNCGSVGTSDFVDGNDFALLCPEPSSLTATNLTTTSARLQWQVFSGITQPINLYWKASTATTWNSVTGIVGTSYSLTGLQRNTNYQWQVQGICTAISSSSLTNANFQTLGCEPTFTYGCTYSYGLNGFSLNEVPLSTNSGCSATGNSSFTATSATVSPGRSYSFAGMLLNQYNQMGVSIWADLNRNGSFEQGTELVFQTSQLVASQFRGSFAIPSGTATGPLDIRVIASYDSYPTQPCGSYQYGEAEDYVLTVVPATGCALPTLSVSGSSTITPGRSAPLIVSQTGNIPYSFTIGNNGTTQVIIVQDYTLPMVIPPVNPTTTTVYTPLSVSNACGVGAVTGSATVVVQNCDPPTGLFESEKTTNNIRLNWQPLAVASYYAIKYREVGTANFSSYSTYGGYTYLYSLTYGKTYEWQIQTICNNGGTVTDFTPLRTFTMSCPEPFSLTEVGYGTSSVYLQWGYTGNTSSVVQYRVVGTTAWTSATVSGGSGYYNPAGLVLGGTYEWQVKVVCTDGNSTGFSPIRTFMVSCNLPTGLSANNLTGSTAQLSWYGNSNTQYELRWRPQSPANSFYTSVTGLSGSTGYALTGLTTGIGYEFQVKTVCSVSASSAFSAPYSFTPQCGSVYYPSAYDISSTGASLYWYNSNSNYNIKYNLVYRPVGAPTSTTISGLTSNFYSLTGLTNSTVYECRVQVICPDGSLSVFSEPGSFTTQCSTPGYTYLNTVRSNSAEVGWNGFGSDVRYDLVYRVAGSPTSTTISSLTGTYYAITGLNTSTVYEWKVRTVCSDGNTSAFSAPLTFTTTACQTPSYNYENYVITTSAQVYWGANAGLNYVLQWRPVGTSGWPSSATVAAPTTGYVYSQVYSITGLTNGVAYEWRVGTLCTDNTQSAFTTPRSFTTNCPVPYAYLNAVSSTAANVSWYINGPLPIVVRWRVMGNPATAWTESGTLAVGTYTYSLTGLTNGNIYEWQVGALCGGGIISYSTSSTFLTQCSIPSYTYYNTTTDKTATLAFGVYNLPSIGTFDIQFRPQGTTSWSQITGLSSNTLLLTNLIPATTYEWQARTNCTDGNVSAYSSMTTFITRSACAAMYTVRNGYWNDSSTWSCGFTPTLVHDAEVRHLVTLPNYSPANQARQVKYGAGGRLIYQTGGRLQLGQ
jgi:GEVED domain/Fibronectin type III domain/Pregnancy-associated plasma protein-A